MNLIVNVSTNWAIGTENGLLFHISQDMKYFKEHTTGKTVVMGRKTLESLPKGNPLPNRKNIVLTRDESFTKDGVTVYHSIDELLKNIGIAESFDTYIMGGESIYRELLPYCSMAFVTKVDEDVEDADAFMVNLDDEPGWEIQEESETFEEKGYKFRFVTYVQK